MFTNILEEYSAAIFTSTMKSTQCHGPEGRSLKLAGTDMLTLQSSTLRVEEQGPGSLLITLASSVMRWTFLVEALCVDSHIKTDTVPKPY